MGTDEVVERAGPVGESGLEAAQRLFGVGVTEPGVTTTCLVVAVAPSALVVLPNEGIAIGGLPEATAADFVVAGATRGGLELSISMRVGFEEVEEAEEEEGAAWKSAKSSSSKGISVINNIDVTTHYQCPRRGRAMLCWYCWGQLLHRIHPINQLLVLSALVELRMSGSAAETRELCSTGDCCVHYLRSWTCEQLFHHPQRCILQNLSVLRCLCNQSYLQSKTRRYLGRQYQYPQSTCPIVVKPTISSAHSVAIIAAAPTTIASETTKTTTSRSEADGIITSAGILVAVGLRLSPLQTNGFYVRK